MNSFSLDLQIIYNKIDDLNFIYKIVIPGHTFQDPKELLQFVRRDPDDKKYYCTLCEKFAQKIITLTRNHVESQHFPDTFSYPCDLCGDVLTTNTKLQLHRTRKHLNKRNFQ